MLPNIKDAQPSELVARGNRLFMLRQQPGYLDLFKLSESLAEQAVQTLIEFPGWDTQQIALLKARAQAAQEFHSRLFGMVNSTMSEASSEADRLAEEAALKRSDKEVGDDADELREEAFKKFEEMDFRISGSY